MIQTGQTIARTSARPAYAPLANLSATGLEFYNDDGPPKPALRPHLDRPGTRPRKGQLNMELVFLPTSTDITILRYLKPPSFEISSRIATRSVSTAVLRLVQLRHQLNLVRLSCLPTLPHPSWLATLPLPTEHLQPRRLKCRLRLSKDPASTYRAGPGCTASLSSSRPESIIAFNLCIEPLTH